MTEMPVIRVELEGMRYQVLHALQSHNQQIEELVTAQLDKVIAEFDYASVVREVAARAITNAINKAVTTYFESGNGWKEITQVVQDTLDKRREGSNSR